MGVPRGISFSETIWGHGGHAGGPPCKATGIFDVVRRPVIVCFSSAELRRVSADPAGGLPLREDLQRQRPGLPG